MRYLALIFCAFLVSGCSHSFASMPAVGSAQFQQIHAPSGTQPKIKGVTKIRPMQYQTIVITGSGFGTMNPYNGDSAYLQILDTTGGWSAGLKNGSQTDTVWLDVTKWSDNQIVIAGFTHGYGQSGWTLKKKDRIVVNVWNAQDGNGPATRNTRVK